MIGALGTAALLLGANGAGLAWSWVRAGVPDGTAKHPAARLRRHLPLIAGNVLAQTALACTAVAAFPDAFTLAWPGVVALVTQVFLVLVADDLGFYLWHRFLHEHREAYRRIHALHHRAYDPLPIEYIHAHPVEVAGGAVASTVAFAAIGAWAGSIPLWSFWAFGLVRIAHELEIHRGRVPGGVVPWLADSEHHGVHHARPNAGNYASTFPIWDRVFGTRSTV